MLFNSIAFLIFAAVFFSVWSVVSKISQLRCLVIVAASFLFYGWWDWRFLFLIVASGLIDYFAGLMIGTTDASHFKKRLYLTISLVANLGTLSLFKYYGFFAESLAGITALFGLTTSWPTINLILPVGISFYTFQSMSYTIDIYRGHLKPTRNLFQFFAYLAMFPQLVAGPIVRASELIPKLGETPVITGEDRWRGLKLIVHGYFKKMVIADSLGPVVDAAFSSSTPAESCVYWWLVMSMFAFQIYCDFSGYSDIARGLGKWMGYPFPENFNHPYSAQGFRDFWSRWHISLSTWFRDYVYIPLGGSRGSNIRSHVNMWITMVLSGLWHGASWTFIVWGMLHSLYLSIERLTHWPSRLRRFGVIGTILNVLITFVLACVAWMFFRADSFLQAYEVLTRMSDFSHHGMGYAVGKISKFAFVALAIAALREMFFVFKFDTCALFESKAYENIRVMLLAGVIVATVLFRGPGQNFVYFQF